MLTSKLIAVLRKASLRKTTPALVIGVTLGLSTFSLPQTSKSSWALAQVSSDIDHSAESASSLSSPLAITAGTYFRPPRNPSPSGPRTTTGTRTGSCVGNPTTAFTTLGPDSVVGYTAATRPEFVWYLPASEKVFPVTFRLLAPNEQGIPAPIHTAELTYTAGFSKYQLPPNLPALSANQEYRWQIIVECDPARPARSLAQELSFELVPAPAAIAQLSADATPVEKAIAYAEQGLWYDAIAQVAQATTPRAKQMRFELLRDLAESESVDESLRQDLLNIANSIDQ